MSMWATDQSQSQQWLADFNPDARINPHDVDQSGAGRFMEVGRFDPNKSSQQGGIFAGEAEMDYVPRGNVAAVQRVKARNSSDFLERLALAEARDGESGALFSGNDDLVHYAGARPQPKRQLSARSRANAIMNKQQAVMDKTAEEQRQRQWANVAKQGYLTHYRDEDDGMGKAAGGRSKTLVVQQKLYEQQQQTFSQATQQQDRRAMIQRQQQHQQQAQEHHQRMRQQQQAAANASAAQLHMMRQQEEERKMDVVRHEQMHRQHQQEQQFKTAWAANRAKQQNSSGIMFG
jgi:flagellar biosynthesis GTPase FlhF